MRPRACTQPLRPRLPKLTPSHLWHVGTASGFTPYSAPPDRGLRFSAMPSIRGLQFSTPVGKKTETLPRAEASPHAAEDVWICSRTLDYALCHWPVPRAQGPCPLAGASSRGMGSAPRQSPLPQPGPSASSAASGKSLSCFNHECPVLGSFSSPVIEA